VSEDGVPACVDCLNDVPSYFVDNDPPRDLGPVVPASPYRALGYELTLPMHRECEQSAAKRAGRCGQCGESASNRLDLFWIDSMEEMPGGFTVLCPEHSRFGLMTLITRDGTLMRRCMACREWSTDVYEYDIDYEGQNIRYHPRCAAAAAANTGESFVDGFETGVKLGALASLVRFIGGR
jgi:hypothetical protein